MHFGCSWYANTIETNRWLYIAIWNVILFRDKLRESNIVNKTFIVDFVPGDSVYDSEEDDLTQRSGRRSNQSIKVRMVPLVIISAYLMFE